MDKKLENHETLWNTNHQIVLSNFFISLSLALMFCDKNQYSFFKKNFTKYISMKIDLRIFSNFQNPERLHGKKNVPSKITVQRVVELDRDKESYESWGTKMNNDDDSDSYSDSDSSESTKKTTNSRQRTLFSLLLNAILYDWIFMIRVLAFRSWLKLNYFF